MKSFKQRRKEAIEENDRYIKLRDEHEFTSEEVKFMIRSGIFLFLTILSICLVLVLLVSL